MLTRDLIKKVRRIEIRTRRVVRDQMAGQYHSVFKGRGMAFDEVRQYQPGDDVRVIDWNVSARSPDRELFVKVFSEERELTVMLLVDMSASGRFGSRTQTKAEVLAELSAVLAFSAVANNDRVGLVIFTDEVERYVPPRKGTKHVLRVVTDVLSFKPARQGTNLESGLSFLNKVTRHGCVAFLLSDFQAERASYEKALKVAARKHDLVAFRVVDPLEEVVPDLGLVHAEDAETGERVWLDTGDANVRRWLEQTWARENEERERLFARLNLDTAQITAGAHYERDLVRLFQRRARRMAA